MDNVAGLLTEVLGLTPATRVQLFAKKDRKTIVPQHYQLGSRDVLDKVINSDPDDFILEGG
jgi:hypothetical protein